MKSGSNVLMAVVLLAAGIFAIDLELPLGVSGGVLYVAVVLLALWYPDPRMPLLVALGCSILTALGFVFSPHGGVLWVVIVNRSLAIFAIWVTAILSVRWRSAQRRMSQQQERLERVSRVNTMGEMASGIAHELNQPLSTILNYTEASLLAVRGGRLEREDLLQDLEAISDAAERSGAIVRHLRDLIANREIERSPQNLNQLTREALAFMNRDVERSGTTLHLELRPALPPVLVDSVQIQQVVVNLARNAMDAMQEMETVRRALIFRTMAVEKDCLQVSVRDFGHGVAAESRQTVFDAFYTSKDHGMGMGLAISRSVVEEHGGRLWLEEGIRPGAEFRFTLPIGGQQQS